MLTQEESQLLTRTGPGTPAGDMFRCYWHPVSLSEELPPGGAPLNVRILSEDLVLFRDDQGRPGLLGLHCAHRGTDLSYGRCEDGGLRCVYHGWLYDIHGRCLEQPGEPRGSQYYKEIRHLSYPCREAGGFIFTYMGSGEPPLLPAYEWLSIPEERLDVEKHFYDCNYLQGFDGTIDPGHLGILHRLSGEEMEVMRSSGRTWGATPETYRVPGTTDVRSADDFVLRDLAPVLELEEADFGLRIFSIRDAGPGKKYGRAQNFVFPNMSVFPTATEGYSVAWTVPVDDTHHCYYQVNVSRTEPFDKEWLRQERSINWTRDYRMIRNEGNRYLQDRDAMKAGNSTGLGTDFIVHDVFATQSAGPIQDRAMENLGYTDKPVAAARKLLLQAIRDVQEGHEAPHVIRDPAANCFDHLRCAHGVVPSSADWRTEWVTYTS